MKNVTCLQSIKQTKFHGFPNVMLPKLYQEIRTTHFSNLKHEFFNKFCVIFLLHLITCRLERVM